MNTLKTRPSARRSRPPITTVTQAHLLRAAALGARTAQAHLAGDPEQARACARSFRRLRRTAAFGTTRDLLQVAHSVGYGQQMSAHTQTIGHPLAQRDAALAA